MALADLFPKNDFHFQMGLERSDPARFFQPTAQHDGIIRQRAHWLQAAPEIYSALRPEGLALLDETLTLAGKWQGLRTPSHPDSPSERLRALGQLWEPDFLLLRLDADGEIRLYGGCVCFPSSWRLSEKMGRPMKLIHGPVPGLNASLGTSIHKFLGQLKPGAAWQRTNWGISASPELNQHPDQQLTALSASVQLGEAWLRVEHQALVSLPVSGGILFGIRIAMHPLSEVQADRVAAARLGRALETMPAEVARYKNLSEAKAKLVELLRA